MSQSVDVGVFGLLPEILAELRALRRENAEVRLQLAALQAPAPQQVLFSADVAQRYGKSTEAFNAWLRRPGGKHVAAIAIEHNGRRCWRRVDLEMVERVASR